MHELERDAYTSEIEILSGKGLTRKEKAAEQKGDNTPNLHPAKAASANETELEVCVCTSDRVIKK